MINAIWRAAFVRRWHANPDMSRFDDTTGAHGGRCALLVMAIFPDHSHDLLKAAVAHDNAEDVTGDWPAEFKVQFPDIAQAGAEHEAGALAEREIATRLTAQDARRLKYIDRLDAYKFVELHNPAILERNDWQDAARWLRTEASALTQREAA